MGEKKGEGGKGWKGWGRRGKGWIGDVSRGKVGVKCWKSARVCVKEVKVAGRYGEWKGEIQFTLIVENPHKCLRLPLYAQKMQANTSPNKGGFIIHRTLSSVLKCSL